MRIELSDVTHDQLVKSASTAQDGDQINNSIVTGTSHESVEYDLYPGVMVTYQCQPHYEPINTGLASRICLTNGTWSGQPLDCKGKVAWFFLISNDIIPPSVKSWVGVTPMPNIHSGPSVKMTFGNKILHLNACTCANIKDKYIVHHWTLIILNG